MTAIPIPENYGSIERLIDWLKTNIPHEFDVDGGPRWIVFTAHMHRSWRIEFAREQDATLFNLLWI